MASQREIAAVLEHRADDQGHVPLIVNWGDRIYADAFQAVPNVAESFTQFLTCVISGAADVAAK